MRFLMKVSIPVEAGNVAARDGFKKLQEAIAEIKPEAAYFIAEGGRRVGYLVVNFDNAAKIPALAEPCFLALNAGVDLYPAMTAQDLAAAATDIAQAVKKYG
jgi:hypothetical protein